VAPPHALEIEDRAKRPTSNYIFYRTQEPQALFGPTPGRARPLSPHYSSHHGSMHSAGSNPTLPPSNHGTSQVLSSAAKQRSQSIYALPSSGPLMAHRRIASQSNIIASHSPLMADRPHTSHGRPLRPRPHTTSAALESTRIVPHTERFPHANQAAFHTFNPHPASQTRRPYTSIEPRR
jgi:hypothetical protein